MTHHIDPNVTQQFDVETLSPKSRTPAEFEKTCVSSSEFIPGYEIIELIGEGGFGKVFKARHYKLDRLVALKIIAINELSHQKQAKRFEMEAITLARLHHSNIVPVYDTGRTDQAMYLAMELLEGEDLDSLLRREAPLDERQTWNYIRQAALGLAHASAEGIVHRDIKPANLFLAKTPHNTDRASEISTLKITDFGLALAKWEIDKSARQTAPGLAVGTPAYMAPEQHRGGVIDFRADIYALGATAYHALTGRPPFEGETVWEVIAQKLGQTPRPFPTGLEQSAKLINAMMKSNVNERIQTYSELIERIDRLQLKSHSRVQFVSAGKTNSRRNGFKILFFALMVLAISLIVYFGRSFLNNKSNSSAPLITYVSEGNPIALFDGVSLDRWSSSGAWSVQKDDEGTSVLNGSGLIRRTYQPSAYYRILLGVDLYESTAVEVYFGITANESNRSRIVLRVTRERGAELGIRKGDQGEFQAINRAVPYPPAQWFKSRQPYLETRIERTGLNWSAWFNGEFVGLIADDKSQKLEEFRVLAAGGEARIDTAVFEKIKALK